MPSPDSAPDINKIIQNAQEKGRNNFNSDFDEAMKDIKNSGTADHSGNNAPDDEEKKAWQGYDRDFVNNDDAKFTEPETIETETVEGNNGPDILDKERPGVTVDAEYVDKEEGILENSKALVTTNNTYEKKAIEDFEKGVSEARKEYLEMDYKKTDAIGRIMKFFGGSKNVNTAQDQDIAYYKKNYEDKLAEWRNFLIEDARKHGANEEELAKIYVQFRTEQKIILADEHDNVKIEQQEGSMEGRIKKAMVGAHKWYKEQPLAAKLAVSAILIGTGAGLSCAGVGAGTLVSGIFCGSVALKRFVTGAITGVGTTLSLEALGQNRAKKKIEKEKQEFLKEMMGKSEDERYKVLNDRMEKIIAKEERDALKKIKNQDVRQLAAGAAVGTLLGSGIAADIVKWGCHGVAEYFGLGHVSGAGIKPGSEFPKPPAHGIFAGADKAPMGGTVPAENIQAPGAGSIESPNSGIDLSNNSEVPFYQQVAGVAPPTQFEYTPSGPSGDILTIHQGSSIEKTLIEHLREQGVKNPGHEAHKMFLDYMRDNKESITQKIGDGEYNKMLKDGMVNVKAGTGLNIVMENGELKLHDITGDMSHIEHPNVSHIIDSHVDHSNVTAKDIAMHKDLMSEVRNSNVDIQSEIDKLENYKAHLGGPNDVINRTPEMLRADHEMIDSRLQKLRELASGNATDTEINKEWADMNKGVDKEWIDTNARINKDFTQVDKKWVDMNTKLDAANSVKLDGHGGAGVLHDITSEHLNAPVSGVEHVSGHQIGEINNGLETFNSSDLHLPEGSSVTFEHDINGNPILKRMAFSGMLYGSNGHELFVGNFHEKILESVSNSGDKAQLLEKGLMSQDRQILGYLKIHDGLLKTGHTREAAAVLKSINNAMDITEKKMGLSGLFDRSKLPFTK